MIEVRHLTIGYGTSPLVKDISFEIGRGECVLLSGANGTGKSTLMRTLSGILPPLKGSIGPFRAVLIPTGIPKVRGFTMAEFIRTGCYAETDWKGAFPPERERKMQEATDLLGIGDLLDKIFEYFPAPGEGDEDEGRIRVALIGRPNAGKSSLTNRMSGSDRSIVSDIAGTTRDAVDVMIENKYGKFVLVDTAGMRKKSRIEDQVEKYSMVRALSAVDKADVCVIMIDASVGITEQDTRVAGVAHDSGKASIIVINKWDTVDKQTGTLEAMTKMVKERFSFMDYAPVLFISAKTGQRVDKLWEAIVRAEESSSKRLTTGVFNDMLTEAIAMVPTPQDKGKHLKIYYGTQVAIKPPTFALFVNDTELSHFSYERYIENQIRRNFGFEGTPIKILMRNKKGEQT